jgi:hypothetical protein
MLELRCQGCGRLLGFTRRTQAVPAQCTDPFCAKQPPISANEERDALMAHLVLVEDKTVASVGDLFGLTRQGAARALVGR